MSPIFPMTPSRIKLPSVTDFKVDGRVYTDNYRTSSKVYISVTGRDQGFVEWHFCLEAWGWINRVWFARISRARRFALALSQSFGNLNIFHSGATT